jgi:(2R)-3-sulfolactate dehydrogenase (NADP+)
MAETRRLNQAEAVDLARKALRGAGANEVAAASLAAATMSAEAHGKAAVGFAHLIDYLRSLREGRIDGAATPIVSFPAPALVMVDACGGLAQLGFDLAFNELRARAERYGVAVLAQRNSYTTGELGYYVRRLADADLFSLAMSNGPALMAPPGVARAVYCTNPIAFAAPGEGRPALVVDQASSATAFVKIREAAARGETLPEGWAIDAEGAPTTDPKEALAGALLTFGGARGANIALMVEILAAGLCGANWSVDAPDFRSGDRSPGAGLFVIAIAPRLVDAAFGARLESYLQRLEGLGVYTPGRGAQAPIDEVMLTAALVEEIEAFAG